MKILVFFSVKVLLVLTQCQLNLINGIEDKGSLTDQSKQTDRNLNSIEGSQIDNYLMLLSEYQKQLINYLRQSQENKKTSPNEGYTVKIERLNSVNLQKYLQSEIKNLNETSNFLDGSYKQKQMKDQVKQDTKVIYSNINNDRQIKNPQIFQPNLKSDLPKYISDYQKSAQRTQNKNTFSGLSKSDNMVGANRFQFKQLEQIMSKNNNQFSFPSLRYWSNQLILTQNPNGGLYNGNTMNNQYLRSYDRGLNHISN